MPAVNISEGHAGDKIKAMRTYLKELLTSVKTTEQQNAKAQAELNDLRILHGLAALVDWNRPGSRNLMSQRAAENAENLENLQ